jgi:hypothetical protein
MASDCSINNHEFQIRRYDKKKFLFQFIFSSGSNMEIYNETLMYTVAVMAALTYPSQCLPDELLEAKIKVKKNNN